MFNWLAAGATEWFRLTASGLIDAVWASVWHWGLGIGLIILFIAATFFSPIGKQFFAAAAAATFLFLVVYGIGQRDESVICDAKVKVIYLKAHPALNKRNLAKNWRVSPTWNPAKPQKPAKPVCDSPFDTRCWGI
jgi:hypothetical protein